MRTEYININLPVELELDEDGVFTASIRLLPGCISQGFTREEALSNIHEAASAYLESCIMHNEPIPPFRTN